MVTKEMLEAFCRPLTVDDIVWQVQFNKGKSAPVGKTKIMPYITARTVGDRLNNDIRIGNYQISYRETKIIEAGIICSIRLKTGDNEWCLYEDGASASNIEPIKGGISDGKKRAAAAIGLGRELYDFPKVYLQGANLDGIPDWAWDKIKKLTQDIIDKKETKDYYLLTESSAGQSTQTSTTSPTSKPTTNSSSTPKNWINTKSDPHFLAAKTKITAGEIKTKEELNTQYAFNTSPSNTQLVVTKAAKKELEDMLKA